jgi:hypothetical protein
VTSRKEIGYVKLVRRLNRGGVGRGGRTDGKRKWHPGAKNVVKVGKKKNEREEKVGNFRRECSTNKVESSEIRRVRLGKVR